MMKNEITLNKHKSEQHVENPPYICKECLSESNSWYEYVQHMKLHLRYAARCNECIFMMMNKPERVIFLCHECDMSFDSDEQLKIHLKKHLENGQYDSFSDNP